MNWVGDRCLAGLPESGTLSHSKGVRKGPRRGLTGMKRRLALESSRTKKKFWVEKKIIAEAHGEENSTKKTSAGGGRSGTGRSITAKTPKEKEGKWSSLEPLRGTATLSGVCAGWEQGGTWVYWKKEHEKRGMTSVHTRGA